jgi:hypothetical protein
MNKKMTSGIEYKFLDDGNVQMVSEELGINSVIFLQNGLNFGTFTDTIEYIMDQSGPIEALDIDKNDIAEFLKDSYKAFSGRVTYENTKYCDDQLYYQKTKTSFEWLKNKGITRLLLWMTGDYSLVSGHGVATAIDEILPKANIIVSFNNAEDVTDRMTVFVLAC